MAALDPVNALAEQSPGFVWRLKAGDGNSTSIRIFDDATLIVNMSTWRSLEALTDYAYRSAHAEIMRRRREFALPIAEAYLALWWVPRGHQPTIAEAEERLRAPARARTDAVRVRRADAVSRSGRLGHAQGPRRRRLARG